jgi:large subunit ribosomal protein L21
MYAVVKTGGKQYRVAAGDVIKVERLDGEVGATIDLDQVLMVGGGDGEELRVGTPRVQGASVKALVLDQAKGPKILVFKKKRRKNYRRKRGHRQLQTVLRIRDIALA